MNTRCNRSFTEPFQTQLPLRWHWIYPAILFLPISNGSLHISEFFPLHTHTKKKALCFLFSLNQKVLLLMKGSLKNYPLFIFPALFHPVTFSIEVDVYVAFCCLSLSEIIFLLLLLKHERCLLSWKKVVRFFKQL